MAAVDKNMNRLEQALSIYERLLEAVPKGAASSSEYGTAPIINAANEMAKRVGSMIAKLDEKEDD